MLQPCSARNAMEALLSASPFSLLLRHWHQHLHLCILWDRPITYLTENLDLWLTDLESSFGAAAVRWCHFRCHERQCFATDLCIEFVRWDLLFAFRAANTSCREAIDSCCPGWTAVPLLVAHQMGAIQRLPPGCSCYREFLLSDVAARRFRARRVLFRVRQSC